MRSIGVFRTTHTTFASETNSHDNRFAFYRSMARNNAPIVKPKVGSISSAQRTALLAINPVSKTLTRVDYSGYVQNDVKSALRRARNAGCVAPKKANV
jgi:hypothetical protein